MSKANNNWSGFSVKRANWELNQQEITSIREQVFLTEQHVTPELEWDGLDETAEHLLAVDHRGSAIGYARIVDQQRIGRMAVLPDWRGLGVGKALLQMAIATCRVSGCKEISLSAQCYAIGFYEQAGFKVCSEEYLDADIPHRDMTLHLSN